MTEETAPVDGSHTPAEEVLQHFIANLYLAASSQAADDYRKWALGEVRHMVPFDAALWGTGNAQTESLHSITLLGLPDSYPLDLVRTRDDNPLYKALQDEPGQCIAMEDVIEDRRFHRSKVYKKCFKKYKVERILSAHNLDARSGMSTLVSLYRFDRDQHFTGAEKRMQSVIAYHLGKAATHAFFLHLTRAGQPVQRQFGSAVVDRHGMFHEVEPVFLDLIEKHFPDHEQGVLPFPLPDDECNMEFHGLHVQASRLADLILIRLRESGPLDQLTRRERQVVEGVCQGLSHKEIGRELGLAPTTVSSHLYRAYEKLGVASKTALSKLIRAGNPFGPGS